MLSKQNPAFTRAKLLLICWGFVAHAWAGGLEVGGIRSQIANNINGQQTPQATTIQHDAQNRVQVIENANWKISHIRDSRNRVIHRKVEKQSGGNGWDFQEETVFVWNGWSLIEERTTQADGNELMRRYIHGGRLDEILRQENFAAGDPDPADPPNGDDPTLVYHHHDLLGSVVALSNKDAEAIEYVRYTSFGKATIYNADLTPTATNTSNYSNRHLYTGREHLREVNLNDHRNRYYSPHLGRWTTTDPIQFSAGDINLYRYVGNGVSGRRDRMGLAEDNNRHLGEIAEGTLKYSTNCGWIDTRHMGMSKQITDGILGKLDKIEDMDLQFVRFLVSMPWGEDGSGSGMKSLPGGVIVRRSALEESKKQIALGILVELSHSYERFQGMGARLGFYDSSYSEEDLISNLLGYNMAADGMSEEDIWSSCKVIHDHELNRCIYEAHGGLGKNENWGEPVDRNNTYNEVILRRASWTIDYGPAGPMLFPEDLNDPYVGPSDGEVNRRWGGEVPTEEWLHFEVFL